MGGISAWYSRLAATVKLGWRLVVALFLTFAALAAYIVAFHPQHPYLVGLFPVIVCALLLGLWEGVVSLVGCTVFFGALLMPMKPTHQLVLIALFVLEGAVVLWLTHLRQQSASRIAGDLALREREFVKLSQAHNRLVADGAADRQTSEQLRKSNRIMMDTLERIIDDYHKQS